MIEKLISIAPKNMFQSFVKSCVTYEQLYETPPSTQKMCAHKVAPQSRLISERTFNRKFQYTENKNKDNVINVMIVQWLSVRDIPFYGFTSSSF